MRVDAQSRNPTERKSKQPHERARKAKRPRHQAEKATQPHHQVNNAGAEQLVLEIGVKVRQ